MTSATAERQHTATLRMALDRREPAPVFCAATDRELFLALRTADGAERDGIQHELVERVSGLVRWLASRYANPAVEFEELTQVGFVGLVLAIQRFDPDRGPDFAAYAKPTVQGEIRRYFRDKRRWIRLPRRLQETKAVLRAATESLGHELGRAPTVSELAARLAVDEELILEAMTADDVFAPQSLDAPIGADDSDSWTLGESLGEIEHRMELAVDCMALRPLIEALPPRERTILQLRFYEDMTQSQIGERVGLSQMHVSRLLTRILDDLRTHMVQD